MAKELERARIPAVLICTMVSVARAVGANRVVPGSGIPHPCGNPDLSPEAEERARLSLVEQAVALLATVPEHGEPVAETVAG